jgi:serine/threonine protein kinase
MGQAVYQLRGNSSLIGQIINYRYEVLEKVGEGDIFTVYKARDKVLNRLVALKSLNTGFADNVGFATAVRAGYQAVAPLDHPCIARVLEADPASNESFVACEYVRGINVKDRVSRAGAMQVSTALDIIVPVLEALEYAHANRIVHGDLRPQDVIVGPDGEVKVTDFGMASALRACPEIADRLGMRSIHYEAPEIVEGAAPSVTSDLYSAGVILYEMLTGTLPFDGPTAVSIALKQAKDTPTPPRALNTAVPKSLSDLVMRAIEKSPHERYATASDMLADLRAIRDALRAGKPVSVPQPSVSARANEPVEREDEGEPDGLLSRSWYLWLIIGFVLTVALVGGLTLALNTKATKIDVPMIVGKTLDEARDIAREAGVTLEQDDPGEVYSNDNEEGKIAVQFPVAHSQVPRDKPVVKYKLSKGPSAKAIPDLLGLPEAEAYQAAEDAGFAVGKVTTEYSDKVPVNSVVKQDPAKGTLSPPQSSISLVISLGPKPEPPPDTSSSSQPAGDQRNFQVAVTVPSDATGQQEVRIVVNDDRGETTAVQEFHDPGDKFNQTVTAFGNNVRIRVYVAGRVASDERY